MSNQETSLARALRRSRERRRLLQQSNYDHNFSEDIPRYSLPSRISQEQRRSSTQRQPLRLRTIQERKVQERKEHPPYDEEENISRNSNIPRNRQLQLLMARFQQVQLRNPEIQQVQVQEPVELEEEDYIPPPAPRHRRAMSVFFRSPNSSVRSRGNISPRSEAPVEEYDGRSRSPSPRSPSPVRQPSLLSRPARRGRR